MCLTVASCSHYRNDDVLSNREFASLIESFSETDQSFRPSNGYESQNWVSNERSFQQIIPGLARRENGSYIGVGPEQNFTYISFLEPRIAFIVDIRRANLALHLFYKALFELSVDRAEFVSRLFCRGPIRGTTDESAQELFAALEVAPLSEATGTDTHAAILDRLVRYHGLTLTDLDRTAINAASTEFCSRGPAVRWSADDRRWIPTYAELMMATGRNGEPHSFLASEDRFRVVKVMQERNSIVPIVGDLGGTKALARIAGYLSDRRFVVDAFYISNVRPYLRGDTLRQFEANLAGLPVDDESALIETRFRTLEPRAFKPDFETDTYAIPMRQNDK
jgi:hypothetical protein